MQKEYHYFFKKMVNTAFKQKHKTKNNNKRKKDNIVTTTLDSMHRAELKRFEILQSSLPDEKKTLKNYEDEYNKLDTKYIEDGILEWENEERYYILQQKIKDQEKKIYDIVNKVEENEYHKKTHSLVVEYNLAVLNSSEVTIKKTNKNTDKTQGGISSFLNIQKNNDEKNNDEKNNDEKNNLRSKSEICKDYMKIVNEDYIDTNELVSTKSEYCQHCEMNFDKKFSMIYAIDEAKMVCPNCCREHDYIDLTYNPPSFKELEEKNITPAFGYQRINHFNEWLAQFQAKEATDIPNEIFKKISYELKTKKITDLSKLRTSEVRRILKDLGLNSYYEHVPYILCTMNGIPAPSFPPKTEEKLRMMFKQIQTPFARHKPANRKNFLSYAYVLHKFCELLELDEYIECFPLLKSREKLRSHDRIWKKICKDLKWQYMESG